MAIGVDTHKDVHVAVALEWFGAQLRSREIETTETGYRSFGSMRRWRRRRLLTGDGLRASGALGSCLPLETGGRIVYRQFHYCWQWPLEASPEALWPLVSDTNRFNRDAGVPALETAGAATSTGTRRLRLARFGIGVEWFEQPFEWLGPYRFSVVRTYLRGPVAEMRLTVELTRRAGGTLLTYQVWAQPRNLLGLVAIPIEVGWRSRRRFAATFRRYDRLTLANEPATEPARHGRLAPRGQARVRSIAKVLLEQGHDPALVARLLELVERADELTLARLRPYALADAWGASRRTLLELCLHATRAGLLDLRWDVLCPLCRGPQRSESRIGALDRQIHCESCNIDFAANFEHSVELSFRPNAAMREVELRQFCVGGPQLTPHIVLQQLLAPGERRTLSPALEPGRYRLRARGLRGQRAVLVTEGAGDRGAIRIDGAWPPDELRLGRTPTLVVENASDGEQLVVLERTAWSDDAATAADVTALQVFRDLFASEVLRPDEPISVGSLTVLFTDLRDSTRFYREVGDAPAFGSVMEHLDVLQAAIAREEGAVVKTMGDAVMAVFRRPCAAVRAALNAQRELADPHRNGRPQLLKVGIHLGPCIAVSQNDRLDYFGSTVNAAARLVDLSSGEDVIVSGAVRADPEVTELLTDHGMRLNVEPLQTELKGFEDRFELWRLAEP